MDGYVEEDQYKSRDTDSLYYHYSKEDVQYILRRCVEKSVAVVQKEMIDLTSDSD